ncbi:MAG TPA: transketolase [Lachnospiraceae bacterium]|nr:transketolase [Lachnospiraceae bacterium]
MLTEEHKKELILRAAETRKRTVELILHGKGGHIGGDLSETEVMVALFDILKHDPANPSWDGRDRFILSKGHCAETYYTLLAMYGYIGKKELDSFGTFGALLGGHPNRHVHGVEANTGSLGHGLGLAVGTALALKMDQKPNRVAVLTGDGELGEGSNWEAAMAASKYNLDNLTWIVDRNHLQISGNTEDVMPLEGLKDKAEAFGFYTMVVDGHDFEQIYCALNTNVTGKPVCIIANTVKGKGLPEAENQASWHHKTPTADQVKEVEEAYETIKEELR